MSGIWSFGQFNGGNVNDVTSKIFRYDSTRTVTDPKDCLPLWMAQEMIVGYVSKGTVTAATTIALTYPITGSGTITTDGHLAVTGDTILVKDQVLPKYNGVYLVGVPWTRIGYMDTWAEIYKSSVIVRTGSANANSTFSSYMKSTGTLDSDTILWNLTARFPDMTNYRISDISYERGRVNITQGAIKDSTPVLFTEGDFYETIPGFEISGTGNPINGNLTFDLTTGYQIPTTAQLNKLDSLPYSIGDWHGTFDGHEGSYYLAYDNLTGKPTIPIISNTAYGLSWSTSLDGASKAALYAKIETLGAGAHSLSTGHTDVLTSSVANNNILQWNGTKWVNRSLSAAGIQPAGRYVNYINYDSHYSQAYIRYHLTSTKDSISYVEASIAIDTVKIDKVGFMSPNMLNKLNGIESGAQKNVKADWTATTGDALILHKPLLYTRAQCDSIYKIDSMRTMRNQTFVYYHGGRVDSTATIKVNIGDYYQGGYVFYIDPSRSWGLCAASSELATSYQWSSTNVNITTRGTAIGTGQANTDAIIATHGANCAAYNCKQYLGAGYTDWYLPARDELDSIYKVLVVKKGLPYGTGHQKWSSTQNVTDATTAWFHNWSTTHGTSGKDITLYVIPVRTWSLTNANTLPPGVNGATVYFNNGSWQILQKGTDGQVLKLASGLPAWASVSAGSGTVTSFSAGTLSGVFTTSVATSTTTPVLSFTPVAQSPYTVYSRGSGTGTASFQALTDAFIPNDITITSAGALTVTAGTSSTSVIHSNTSGSTDVTLTAGSGMTITETGNNITLSSTGGGVWPGYPESGIVVSDGSAWTTSITNNSTNWNTAYTDRLKWDGGSSGLTAATGRSSLGLTSWATSTTTDNSTNWNTAYTNRITSATLPLSITSNVISVAQFGTSASGIVPASGGGTTNFMRADGTWAAPPGGGSTVSTFATITTNTSPVWNATTSRNAKFTMPSTAATFTSGNLTAPTNGDIPACLVVIPYSSTVTLTFPTGYYFTNGHTRSFNIEYEVGLRYKFTFTNTGSGVLIDYATFKIAN